MYEALRRLFPHSPTTTLARVDGWSLFCIAPDLLDKSSNTYALSSQSPIEIYACCSRHTYYWPPSSSNSGPTACTTPSKPTARFSPAMPVSFAILQRTFDCNCVRPWSTRLRQCELPPRPFGELQVGGLSAGVRVNGHTYHSRRSWGRFRHLGVSRQRRGREVRRMAVALEKRTRIYVDILL